GLVAAGIELGLPAGVAVRVPRRLAVLVEVGPASLVVAVVIHRLPAGDPLGVQGRLAILAEVGQSGLVAAGIELGLPAGVSVRVPRRLAVLVEVGPASLVAAVVIHRLPAGDPLGVQGRLAFLVEVSQSGLVAAGVELGLPAGDVIDQRGLIVGADEGQSGLVAAGIELGGPARVAVRVPRRIIILIEVGHLDRVPALVVCNISTMNPVLVVSPGIVPVKIPPSGLIAVLIVLGSEDSPAVFDGYDAILLIAGRGKDNVAAGIVHVLHRRVSGRINHGLIMLI